MTMIRFTATTFFAVALVYPFATLAIDKDGADGTPKVGIVSLSPEQLSRSGLKLEPLTVVSALGGTRVAARILDFQPLMDQRADYQAARSELAIAEAARRVSRQNRQRLAALHHESIVATRELNQAEAALATESARFEAATIRLDQIRETLLQTWGNEVFRIVSQPHGGPFESWLRRTQLLGLLSLPSGHLAPAAIGSSVQIQPTGDRDAAVGQLLGPAPRTDEATQAETWYFTVPAGRLRTGMRLEAWLADGKAASTAVALPVSAVVWHAGAPWVYVKTGESEFTRRPIGSHREQNDRWLVSSGFQAAEEVAVSGAQMLLSQELKGAIPKEDDD
jgi:hypothetical protein